MDTATLATAMLTLMLTTVTTARGLLMLSPLLMLTTVMDMDWPTMVMDMPTMDTTATLMLTTVTTARGLLMPSPRLMLTMELTDTLTVDTTDTPMLTVVTTDTDTITNLLLFC